MTTRQTSRFGSHRRRPGRRRGIARLFTCAAAAAVLGLAALHQGGLGDTATRIALLHGSSSPTPMPDDAMAIGGTAVSGPAVSGPAVSGPAVSGPAVSSPELNSPAVNGPAVSVAGLTRATSMVVDSGRQKGLRFRTVDDPADPTFNQLLGISDSGRIVGYFGSGTDAAHPNKGFRVRSPFTHFVDENVPGSAQTQVVAVNNHGVTAGFSVDAAGANTGFIEVNGRFTAVTNPQTDPGHPFDQLLGINDCGIAVGFYTDTAGAAHGYTYDIARASFAAVTLPVKADAVTATGINQDGDISGFYVTGKTTAGFQLEHTGSFRSLSFGAGTNTQALGIDNADELVGSYLDAAGAMHGFLWSRHRLITIDDPHGAGGSLVNGLNNRGQLVGFFVDAAGLTHGFQADRHS